MAQVAKGHDDQVQKMKDKLDEQGQLVKQVQRGVAYYVLSMYFIEHAASAKCEKRAIHA